MPQGPRLDHARAEGADHRYSDLRNGTDTPIRSETKRADCIITGRDTTPLAGRWLACDPLGIRMNDLYAYCLENPITRTDPNGMQDSSTTAVGIRSNSSGVTVGPLVLSHPDQFVVSFGRSDSRYMDTAERNTGLTAINIQDRINLMRGVGMHFPSSFTMEEHFNAPERGPGGLYPMFSGVMTQEALEGKTAATVHFDMRGVELTPPLPAGGSPGFAEADFHSSSEARQAIAHLASTGPGERNVNVVIEHEEGVTTIPRGSNAAYWSHPTKSPSRSDAKYKQPLSQIISLYSRQWKCLWKPRR